MASVIAVSVFAFSGDVVWDMDADVVTVLAFFFFSFLGLTTVSEVRAGSSAGGSSTLGFSSDLDVLLFLCWTSLSLSLSEETASFSACR